MPYIDKVARAELLGEMREPENCGELNFLFTTIIDDYLKAKGLRYQNINDIIGALEGAKLEVYRRVAADYEDEKVSENGDVYTGYTDEGY